MLIPMKSTTRSILKAPPNPAEMHHPFRLCTGRSDSDAGIFNLSQPLGLANTFTPAYSRRFHQDARELLEQLNPQAALVNKR
jgi:hypothetical protein